MEFDSVITKLTDEMCYAKENFIPIIRDKSAKYLFDFVVKNNIKKVLEIGTAIGFSGSIILSALSIIFLSPVTTTSAPIFFKEEESENRLPTP